MTNLLIRIIKLICNISNTDTVMCLQNYSSKKDVWQSLMFWIKNLISNITSQLRRYIVDTIFVFFSFSDGVVLIDPEYLKERKGELFFFYFIFLRHSIAITKLTLCWSSLPHRFFSSFSHDPSKISEEISALVKSSYIYEQI